jgi:lambda repressor-like predicted transcriptional regulator
MALRRKDGSWQVARLHSGDWHPEEIKAAVRMTRPRMSLGKLAREAGINPNACAHAIQRPHYEGELAIATLLNTPAAEIWPSRHDADGVRVCIVRPRSKPTGEADARHCEKRPAV